MGRSDVGNRTIHRANLGQVTNRALKLGWFLCLIWCPASASAAEGLSLTWSAPEGCPTSDKVVEDVDRLLGEHSRERPLLEVAATVTRDDGGWSVRVERANPDGVPAVRVIHGANCSAIGKATALLLAMMIEPSAVIGDLPSPGPQPQPGPPQQPSQVPPAPQNSAPGLRWSLGAGASLDIGSLPHVAAGLRVAGSLKAGRQAVELGFEGYPKSTGSLETLPGAGGVFSLYLASFTTCRQLLAGPFQLEPCLAAEVGVLHARGFGVSGPGAGTAPWVAGRVGVRASWPLFVGLRLVVQADMVIPVLRPTFALTSVGDVHRPAPIVGRGFLGVERRF
jgi:hypothetical protein